MEFMIQVIKHYIDYRKFCHVKSRQKNLSPV